MRSNRTPLVTVTLLAVALAIGGARRADAADVAPEKKKVVVVALPDLRNGEIIAPLAAASLVGAGLGQLAGLPAQGIAGLTALEVTAKMLNTRPTRGFVGRWLAEKILPGLSGGAIVLTDTGGKVPNGKYIEAMKYREKILEPAFPAERRVSGVDLLYEFLTYKNPDLRIDGKRLGDYRPDDIDPKENAKRRKELRELLDGSNTFKQQTHLWDMFGMSYYGALSPVGTPTPEQLKLMADFIRMATARAHAEGWHLVLTGDVAVGRLMVSSWQEVKDGGTTMKKEGRDAIPPEWMTIEYNGRKATVLVLGDWYLFEILAKRTVLPDLPPGTKVAVLCSHDVTDIVARDVIVREALNGLNFKPGYELHDIHLNRKGIIELFGKGLGAWGELLRGIPGIGGAVGRWLVSALLLPFDMILRVREVWSLLDQVRRTNVNQFHQSMRSLFGDLYTDRPGRVPKGTRVPLIDISIYRGSDPKAERGRSPDEVVALQDAERANEKVKLSDLEKGRKIEGVLFDRFATIDADLVRLETRDGTMEKLTRDLQDAKDAGREAEAAEIERKIAEQKKVMSSGKRTLQRLKMTQEKINEQETGGAKERTPAMNKPAFK